MTAGTVWEFVQSDGYEQRLFVTDGLVTNMETGAMYETTTTVRQEGVRLYLSYSVFDVANQSLIVYAFTRPVGRAMYPSKGWLPNAEDGRRLLETMVLNRAQRLDIAKRIVAEVTPIPNSTESRIKALLSLLGEDVTVYDHMNEEQRKRANALYYVLLARDAATVAKAEQWLSIAQDYLGTIENAQEAVA